MVLWYHLNVAQRLERVSVNLNKGMQDNKKRKHSAFTKKHGLTDKIKRKKPQNQGSAKTALPWFCAKKRIKNQKVNNKITPHFRGVCNFEAEITTPEKTKKQKLHTAFVY